MILGSVEFLRIRKCAFHILRYLKRKPEEVCGLILQVEIGIIHTLKV